MPSEKRLPYYLLTPTLALILFLSIYPMAYGYYLSAHKYDFAPREKRLTFIGARNYVEIFSDDPYFYKNLITTAQFTGGAIAIEFILGLVIALLLWTEFRGIGLLRTLFILPMVTTPVVAAMTWKLVLDPNYGPVNYVLFSLGLSPIPFLEGRTTALPSIILIDAWMWTPFFALVLLAALEGLPAEPLEAAEVDGASYLQRLRRVTLPMIRPIMALCLLFRISDSLKVFDIIFTTTRGGPADATMVLNMYAWLEGLHYMDVGYGSALGIILNFITVAIAIVLLRFIPK